jgi:hypothetical protein
MNPIGDENGILILFGAQALLVLVTAYRTRTARRPVIRGTLTSILVVALLYVALALISLLTHGTGGFQFATWLVLAIVGGLLPAAIIGLIEGFVASLSFRLLGGRADTYDSMDEPAPTSGSPTPGSRPY